MFPGAFLSMSMPALRSDVRDVPALTLEAASHCKCATLDERYVIIKPGGQKWTYLFQAGSFVLA
jgi:hypothetical protein